MTFARVGLMPLLVPIGIGMDFALAMLAACFSVLTISGPSSGVLPRRRNWLLDLRGLNEDASPLSFGLNGMLKKVSESSAFQGQGAYLVLMVKLKPLARFSSLAGPFELTRSPAVLKDMAAVLSCW